MLEEQRRRIMILPRGNQQRSQSAHSRNAESQEKKEEPRSRRLFRMRKCRERQTRREKAERGPHNERKEERGSLDSWSAGSWVYDAHLHPVWPEPETAEDRTGDNAENMSKD